MIPTMVKFIAIRVLRAATVFFAVTFVTFAIVYANPAAIARNVVGISANDDAVRAEIVKLGLDRPLLEQYQHWLAGLIHGDLGQSYFTGQPVLTTLGIRFPVTLALMILSLVLTVVLSVLIGVSSAVRGGWPDRLLQFLSVIGGAIPSFIVAIGLVFAFAVALPLFPATGYVSPDVSIGDWAASITLPVLAILVGSIAGAAAQFRGAVKDVLDRDFVRTLRARGLSERAVIYRHVLRNAGGPGLTVLSLLTIGLLGGVVIIEQVFALPGMGSLVTDAASRGDVSVVMGCVAVTVLLVSVVNLVTDLLTTALNPKARAS
ncbi:ABC transporter permease [Kitasatospora sp. YST-16]|uniref:ABC transporter permease n=1 Tax=Kitasatospora sp. YST-16 TaxID=2998080 RepID=UPI002283CC07|nr:ABC transporter permease [Kitasatospora sp. YST-16]WAL74669.1 ABC transporter permease [Kitasatospora sp. YST-16]WNW40724.1 ABC transporter permease [Streptomyces sp. Li-HN-5-13]